MKDPLSLSVSHKSSIAANPILYRNPPDGRVDLPGAEQRLNWVK
jgi:hypothetical protein